MLIPAPRCRRGLDPCPQVLSPPWVLGTRPMGRGQCPVTEHQCERRFAAPFVLLKPLCSKRGGEKKIMFYYPLSSCCFVLRGSRSEEVWPEEQRCKAQHRAAPLLLPGPFCPTTPAPKGAFGVLLGCWYPSRSGRAELCSQPRCLHRVPPHRSREGAAGTGAAWGSALVAL